MNRTIAIAILLLVPLTACFGQKEATEKKGGFGFNVGFTYGQAVMTTDSEVGDEANLWIQNQGGGSFGILYHHALDPRVSVKAQFNLTILDNFVIYESSDGTTLRKEIFPAFVEVPIHFHFTHLSEKNNISALFGVKISKSLENNLDQEFILKDSFASADFGLGKAFEFERFTLAPEITYSFGLENLYRYSVLPQFAENIEQLVLNQLSIRLLFY